MQTRKLCCLVFIGTSTVYLIFFFCADALWRAWPNSCRWWMRWASRWDLRRTQCCTYESPYASDLFVFMAAAAVETKAAISSAQSPTSLNLPQDLVGMEKAAAHIVEMESPPVRLGGIWETRHKKRPSIWPLQLEGTLTWTCSLPTPRVTTMEQ